MLEPSPSPPQLATTLKIIFVNVLYINALLHEAVDPELAEPLMHFSFFYLLLTL